MNIILCAKYTEYTIMGYGVLRRQAAHTQQKLRSSNPRGSFALEKTKELCFNNPWHEKKKAEFIPCNLLLSEN